jgi:hypothetical protein
MRINKFQNTQSIQKQLPMAPGETAYLIELDGTENANFRQILEGWLDALELHEERSRNYQERDIFSLGMKGEFVGVMRKVQKLYHSVWNGGKLTNEGDQEVLMDLMGSVGLMLSEYRKTRDKYSARWRDNHGNKPTFGPGPADVKSRIVKNVNLHIFPKHQCVAKTGGRCIVCDIPMDNNLGG